MGYRLKYRNVYLMKCVYEWLRQGTECGCCPECALALENQATPKSVLSVTKSYFNVITHYGGLSGSENVLDDSGNAQGMKANPAYLKSEVMD